MDSLESDSTITDRMKAASGGGELYYEELTFTEDNLCDPKSAPNSGFINGKSEVTPNRTALIATAFTAPVRFCKAAEYDRTPHLLPI